MPPAAIVGVAAGGALLGGIAGGLGKKTEQNQTSGVNVGGATALEQQGQDYLNQGMSGFAGLVDAGPGASDVSASLESSRSLADMLGEYSKSGGLPSDSDISTSNNIAAKLFGAQRTQLAQNFQDQTWQANQQAALMGRSMNDPVLRNKLAQEQTRQQQVLDAQQGGFAQQFALNQPMQRLGFAQERTQLLGGLASQAMANRQALVSMGSGVMNQERNWRLATAQHFGTQSQTSGGGVAGAIEGGLAGFGAGASVAGKLGAFGGFGGGGAGGFGGTGFNMGGSNAGSYFGSENPFGRGVSMPKAQAGFGGYGGNPAAPSVMGSYVPLSNAYLGFGK